MKNSKQHNLLFIDDSETEISFIQLLIEIEKLPIIAHFERTAQEGLEYLKSLTQDTYPAVVIVDINMPLMNGFEFAQAFEKKIAALAPNTKLF
ncbi:MAG: response regulator, partial [Bacteroidota bacterium]